jgi:hypothetical protein
MSHLTADQLYMLALDPRTAQIDAANLEHLLTCVSCRTELTKIQQLVQDFTVLKRSTPAPEALARYATLFADVAVRPSAARRFVLGLRAVLRWDSREQPMLQGVRGGGAVAYRQLYSTDHVEMELLVEPQQQRFRLQGEIMAIEESESLGLALVHLIDRNGRVYEAQTERDGRFHCEELPEGVYNLIVSSLTNDILEIETLEIG